MAHTSTLLLPKSISPQRARIPSKKWVLLNPTQGDKDKCFKEGQRGGHGPSYPWPLPGCSVRRVLTEVQNCCRGLFFSAPDLPCAQPSPGGAGLPLIGEHALGRPPAVTGCVRLTQELASFIHIFQSLVLLGVFRPLNSNGTSSKKAFSGYLSQSNTLSPNHSVTVVSKVAQGAMEILSICGKQ